MRSASEPATSPARPQILFIGHSHHTVTKSSEFFIDWLKGIGNVSVEFDECWNSKEEHDYRPIIGSFDIVIVWQLSKIIEKLAEHGHDNLIFVPMYDSIHKRKPSFWRNLKKVKIICFSAALRATCHSQKLDTYFIQYYPARADVLPGGYATKRLFFWQRKGWPNWQTVTSILPVCQFEKLHLHVSIDPGAEIAAGSEIEPTRSETMQANFGTSIWFEEKSDLLKKLGQFNLFFLPREREGIGFSFLDSMEMGLVPVGFNRPTFNEYVVDGINGFFVEKDLRLDLPDIEEIAARMRHYLRKGRAAYLRRLAGLEAFLTKPVEVPEYYNSGVHKIFPKLQRKWRKKKFTAITSSRERNRGPSPLVSVITVVKNDAPGLSRTFQSVFSQTFTDYEYIVVDGKSTDQTVELAKAHESSIDSYSSESDKGPYDAMMKGARLARGRYVIYMNAGDEFAESTSVVDAFQDAPADAGVIYGHSYLVNREGHVSLKHARSLAASFQLLREKRPLPKDWAESLPMSGSSFVERAAILDLPCEPDPFFDTSLVMRAVSWGSIPYHTNTVVTRLGGAGPPLSQAETIAAMREIAGNL